MTSPHQRFPHASRLAVAFVTIVGLLALGLAGFKLFGLSVHDSAAPRAAEETLQLLADATSAAPTTRSIATLPTIIPSQQTAGPIEPAPRADYVAAPRPAL